MTAKICDKCKKNIDESPFHDFIFPVVIVHVCKNYAQATYGQIEGKSRGGIEKVDLCNDCQKKIYEFIFGESPIGG